jgi:sodium-dependent dicarboxylate transporter 2/3/5
MDGEGYPLYKKLGLVAGPIAFGLILLLPTPEGMTVEGQKAAAVTTLMAIWWITEALPLAATALVPIALYPPLGILSGSVVTRSYGDANIFLFAGGFFIAMAMQKWNLHERVALNIVYRTGTNPSRLVLGFMLGTAFLSMWISNTATALMMLPIATAVIYQMQQQNYPGVRRFATALLLSIAYSASIGGIATLIGTPPNGVLLTQYGELFPDAPSIGFFQWMLLGVPLTAILLPTVWLLLTRVLFSFRDVAFPAAHDEIRGRIDALGRMKRGERIVTVVWATTAFAWIFMKDINLGIGVIPGWTRILPDPSLVNHGTVAIAASIVLFLAPVDVRRGEFALDWEWAKRIPWDVLLLFGGGIAMADAFKTTGLVEWVGDRLELLEGVPPILVILAIAAMLTFLTEVTSNTATASIMLPILGGAAAPALGVHPLLLMIPAALSVSCAFMLPVATPPNAIVFGGGHITVPQMARAGFLLNLVGTLFITTLTYLIAVPVFGITLDSVPDWAVIAPQP